MSETKEPLTLDNFPLVLHRLVVEPIPGSKYRKMKYTAFFTVNGREFKSVRFTENTKVLDQQTYWSDTEKNVPTDLAMAAVLFAATFMEPGFADHMEEEMKGMDLSEFSNA